MTLDKAKPTEGKESKKWYRNQRSTHSYTQDSHKTSELKAAIQMQMTWWRPMWSLFVPSVLMSLYELCPADLEGLICSSGTLHSHSLAFTRFLISLPHSSLRCERKELTVTSELGWCVLRSFPLCVNVRLSVWKLLWW